MPAKPRKPIARRKRPNRRATGPHAAQERRLNALWGKAIHVLGRDRCALTGYQGTRVHACHIVGKEANPFLRWELRNGILLRDDLHAAFDGHSGSLAQGHVEKHLRERHGEQMAWADAHRHDRGRRLHDLDEVEAELVEAIEKGEGKC